MARKRHRSRSRGEQVLMVIGILVAISMVLGTLMSLLG
jgi:hypothetical protein